MDGRDSLTRDDDGGEFLYQRPAGGPTATYRALNIAAPQFTDPDIIPGVTVIKAAHLNELREAVRNLE